jgi:hypothetical protein
MTATWTGLQALSSSAGYEHYNLGELSEQVKNGCPLCRIIFDFCATSWRKERYKNLRFYAVDRRAPKITITEHTWE